MSKDERLSLDASVNSVIMGCASFRYADTVLAYFPTGDEIDILRSVSEAFKRGKTVAFPLCGNDCTMTFRAVTSTDELIPDKYGIPAPSHDAPEVVCSDSTICLVPGFVFDRSGLRLGYGKGYYDRFLSGFPGTSVGITYSGFLLPSIPHGRFDRRVSAIICETGVIMAK